MVEERPVRLVHNNSKIGSLTGTGQLTPAFFKLMADSTQEHINELTSQLEATQVALVNLQPPVVPYEHQYLFTLIYSDNLENRFDIFTIEEMGIYLDYIESILNYKQRVQARQYQKAYIETQINNQKTELADYKLMYELAVEASGDCEA